MEVGESQKVAPQERVAIVVVEDIQAWPQPGGQPADEAELAVVVALANAAWHGLGELDSSRVKPIFGRRKQHWPFANALNCELTSRNEF